MSHLALLDIVVLVVYLLGITAMGTLFYRRRTGVREYFVAEREMPSIVVVIGLAASYTSSISYLGVPSYAYRENLVPLASIFAAPFALWVVAKMFLPFLFKLNVITCYEYLDLRFGSGARRIASGLFIVSRMLWLVLLSYGAAVALKYALHVPLPDSVEAPLRASAVDPQIAFWVVVLGVLGTTYTMLGGMRAVMWTDLLQFCMLCFGLLATIVVAGMASSDSLAGMWRIAEAAGRTRLFDFSFSWTSGTFWAAIAGGFFISVSDQGVDQIAAQRYLSAESLRASQRCALLSMAVNIPLSLLLYGAGLVLYVLYGARGNPEVARLMQDNPDALLTFFFFDRMPHGVLGLMLATILAATLSCLTSGLNSLSASSVVDIYAGASKRQRSSEELASAGRWATLMWGAIISLGAMWVGNVGVGIMETSYLFLGLAASLNIGIFFTALLIPRASQTVVFYAVGMGLLVSGLVIAAGFHFLWFSFFGGASVLATAWILGWILPPPEKARVKGLTYWTRNDSIVERRTGQPAGSSGLLSPR